MTREKKMCRPRTPGPAHFQSFFSALRIRQLLKYQILFIFGLVVMPGKCPIAENDRSGAVLSVCLLAHDLALIIIDNDLSLLPQSILIQISSTP